MNNTTMNEYEFQTRKSNREDIDVDINSVSNVSTSYPKSNAEARPTRLHIKIPHTDYSIANFLHHICDGSSYHYDIQNFNATSVINARSILGLVYAVNEFPDEMYLVNIDNDGYFPPSIETFAV